MPEPKDKKLYQRAKKYIYKKHPKHSAYRSGLLVQKYKKDFKKKYGNRSPYIGMKTKKKGLKRWFAEKWVNQRGKVGYKYKNDIYRPSKRITRKTPLTYKELSRKELRRARTRKYKYGLVKRFRKTKRHRTKRHRTKKRKQRGGMFSSGARTQREARARSPTIDQQPRTPAAAAAHADEPEEIVGLEWDANDYRDGQNNIGKRWRFYKINDEIWELRSLSIGDEDPSYYGESKGADGDAHRINNILHEYLKSKQTNGINQELLLRLAFTDSVQQARVIETEWAASLLINLNN